MTELPFGTAPDAAEEAGRDRRVLFLGGGLAAVALATVAFLLLGGGEEPAESGAPVASPSGPAAAAPAAPLEPLLDVAAAPAESAVELGRNPFRALYTVPVAAPAAAAVPAALPALATGGSAGSGSASGSGSGSASGSVSGPTPTAPPSETPAAYPVTLGAISEPNGDVIQSTWSYDEQDFQVVPGQRFGRYGELVVLAFLKPAEGEPVTGVLLQVGDAAPITMTIGETREVL